MKRAILSLELASIRSLSLPHDSLLVVPPIALLLLSASYLWLPTALLLLDARPQIRMDNSRGEEGRDIIGGPGAWVRTLIMISALVSAPLEDRRSSHLSGIFTKGCCSHGWGRGSPVIIATPKRTILPRILTLNSAVVTAS
jgi:hypothetical protein